MCNRDNDRSCCENCIAEILQVICALQANACPDCCLDSCDRPALGSVTKCFVCNTRPIMLYTCCGNGTPWSMPVSRGDSGETSSVFRIEKIDGCCATFRVLEEVVDGTLSCATPYAATDSIFTIDINCLCCVRCLNDTYVECL